MVPCSQLYGALAAEGLQQMAAMPRHSPTCSMMKHSPSGLYLRSGSMPSSLVFSSITSEEAELTCVSVCDAMTIGGHGRGLARCKSIKVATKEQTHPARPLSLPSLMRVELWVVLRIWASKTRGAHRGVVRVTDQPTEARKLVQASLCAVPRRRNHEQLHAVAVEHTARAARRAATPAMEQMQCESNCTTLPSRMYAKHRSGSRRRARVGRRGRMQTSASPRDCDRLSMRRIAQSGYDRMSVSARRLCCQG